MAEQAYTDIPDVMRQHVSDTVKYYREYEYPTLGSMKNSTQTVTGGQQGYQIVVQSTDYGQNGAIRPGGLTNSYVQPIPFETLSMWIGLAYQTMTTFEDGTLLDSLDTKEALIKSARLLEARIKNFMKYQNYYAIGDGTGAVAYVTSVTNAGGEGVFTGTTAAQTTSGYTKGATRLTKGVTYDIIDEATFAVVGTITPLANGQGSATVPVTSTGAPNNSGALVCEQGVYNNVARGLAYLINNNDRYFQGVNTATNNWLNSPVVDLNGAAITSATTNTLSTKVQILTNMQDKNMPGGAIAHCTPGIYNTLAIQGFGARQYQAADGQNDTSYGYPQKYKEYGDYKFILDADMDEDRLYFRRASDFFLFELKPFGPDNRDGLDWRQAPGQNNVGANAYFRNYIWKYNFGFSGETSGGDYTSAYAIRAATSNTQVNAN